MRLSGVDGSLACRCVHGRAFRRIEFADPRVEDRRACYMVIAMIATHERPHVMHFYDLPNDAMGWLIFFVGGDADPPAEILRDGWTHWCFRFQNRFSLQLNEGVYERL